jgi:hypothetical protein
MRFLAAIFVIWFAIVIFPERRSDPNADTVTIYAPYTCDTGRWYFETSDEDSVTVNCYHPDPPQAQDDGGN